VKKTFKVNEQTITIPLFNGKERENNSQIYTYDLKLLTIKRLLKVLGNPSKYQNIYITHNITTKKWELIFFGLKDKPNEIVEIYEELKPEDRDSAMPLSKSTKQSQGSKNKLKKNGQIKGKK
jgi:hypothetical protein